MDNNEVVTEEVTAVVENNTGIEIEPLFEELLSAIHNVNGEEKLNLVMLDDAIPAGAKLY
jgi:tRNA-binding protein